MIFDEDKVWNKKTIVYFNDDIKEWDEAIIYIEIPESEAKKIKDIQLVKDAKVNKPTPIVTRQAEHEHKNLNENLGESE